MVQVIETEDRRSRLAEQLGLALGQGLGKGLNTYYANKAMEDVIKDNSNAKASPIEKLTKLQSALAPYGELGRQLFGDRLKIEQQAALEEQEKENTRRMEQEQGILGRFAAGEKLTAEDFGALSPKIQMGLIRHLQQQEEANKKINSEILASQSFSKGYKAILEGDLNTLKDVISDPNTPMNVKTQLGNIQNQMSTRTDVKARESRSRVNSVQSAYNRAISAERSRIGKIGGLRKSEIEEINGRIKELEEARQKDMQMLLKNPESYPSLSIWGNDQMRGFLPEEQELSANEAVSVEEPQESPDVMQRIEFLNERFPPSQFTGKKKQDKSGRIYQSDGNVWRLVQE